MKTKVKMRTWNLNNGESITENELLEAEYSFSVADGAAFYKIIAIHLRGKDPIVNLKKIANHPDNPDDYGRDEQIVRLSEVMRMYKMNKLLTEVFNKKS